MGQAFRSGARSGQRGISFLGIIFFGGIVACTGIVAAQVFPTVLEYQAVLKAINKAKEGNTVAEVRTIYEKASAVDNIEAVKPGDLEITKDGDKVIVSFAYSKEIHLAGPGYLLLKYSGRSK